MRARSEEPADDLGVERGAAGGDARQGVEEVVDVEHAVLEQVAEAAGGHEVDRVAGLDVLGEHEDAEVGIGRAQAPRDARAVVGRGRAACGCR